ncbi:LuxR family transcriptional regulator, csgAB operon transcriptional regulatory protein [Malonomonas rubra DSM 5091]|uniref:LuxR family transcriptional regulator, csgAB operon transcriptional regulatory protein n=1 Tax=Malonomonas rubra DSM 5091 TaxID=1122189 RepID=A0A1M6G891_MALRU|nr:response regulator transcription factor [Malonomonas rubra]SHJ06121.1 LuxR family transcriptional regulator, csgAB operon transcriptional regulatory protein [Malonomonas rubra DSM 5091]
MGVEVIVVGRDYLANELLSHFLAQKLPDCRVRTLTQLDNFHHPPETGQTEKTLLLCDCKSYPPDYFINRLQIYFMRHSNQTYSLFYNLVEDQGLERKLLKQGVNGVVSRDESPQRLLQAIEKVLNGQFWSEQQAMASLRIDNGLYAEKKQEESLPGRLTPRECQILRMISDGSSNESIAENLCISRHTVKTHLYNIFKKIDVSNRMKAAKWAERNLPSSW